MTVGMDYLFVGIRGAVLALDRATGTTQWETNLKESGKLVNVTLQGDDLLASRGRLYPAPIQAAARFYGATAPGPRLGRRHRRWRLAGRAVGGIETSPGGGDRGGGDVGGVVTPQRRAAGNARHRVPLSVAEG